MPQLVLEVDAAPTGSWTPSGPLDPAVRKFGKYPNTADWRPGDLLLVSAAKPDLIERAIRAAQLKGGYSPDDARWHHAAVYIGDGYLCEASFTGVRYVEVGHYVRGHALRVRRGGHTAEEGWRIAVRALTYLRRSYGYRSIIRLGRQALKGFWRPPSALLLGQSRAVICSQLYADSYASVTLRLLVRTGIAVPAGLSNSPELQDIPLAWRTIAGG